MNTLEQLQDPIILVVLSLMVGIFIILLFLLISKHKSLKQLKNTLKEKEEKIQWFRQIDAENERKRVALAHEVELERNRLTQTVESLEKEAKEGTKNQVVSKLEAQQKKREMLLARVRLSE